MVKIPYYVLVPFCYYLNSLIYEAKLFQEQIRLGRFGDIPGSDRNLLQLLDCRCGAVGYFGQKSVPFRGSDFFFNGWLHLQASFRFART
jgi:hypothetical protein